LEAVVQATEEAVLDALVANEEMVGFRGHRSPALPRERVGIAALWSPAAACRAIRTEKGNRPPLR